MSSHVLLFILCFTLQKKVIRKENPPSWYNLSNFSPPVAKKFLSLHNSNKQIQFNSKNKHLRGQQQNNGNISTGGFIFPRATIGHGKFIIIQRVEKLNDWRWYYSHQITLYNLYYINSIWAMCPGKVQYKHIDNWNQATDMLQSRKALNSMVIIISIMQEASNVMQGGDALHT